MRKHKRESKFKERIIIALGLCLIIGFCILQVVLIKDQIWAIVGAIVIASLIGVNHD